MHIAKNGKGGRGSVGCLIFDLEAAPADAVTFEPVDFCFIDLIRGITNESDTFEFAPVFAAIGFLQPSPDANSAARSNYFDLPDRAEDLNEFRHSRIRLSF